ncbi:MAG: hypothetical protein NVSMB2_11890 [Chloroflexota bacterium]
MERDLAERLGIRSVLGVPISMVNARPGVLLLADAQPDQFKGRDILRVAPVADWAGLALGLFISRHTVEGHGGRLLPVAWAKVMARP